jgi:paraquat-inducible protein B
MKKGPSPQAVGAFVVGALVIAISLVVALGSGRLFSKTYPFVVYFRQSVAGLQTGAPVKFKGVTIGSVRSVQLSLREGSDTAVSLADARIPVIFEIDKRLLVREGVGWIDLEDRETAGRWIAEGLRVVLTMESLVTGRKYLDLEVLPGTPVTLVSNPALGLIELPAGPGTGVEELQLQLEDALRRLTRLDIDSALNAFTRTMHAVERLVEDNLDPSANRLPGTLAQLDSTLRAFRALAVSLDSGVVPLRAELVTTVQNAAATSTALRETLLAMRAAAGPESPLMVRLEEALTRLASASYAIETLAEYLARNPSSPLRGKPDPEKDE